LGDLVAWLHKTKTGRVVYNRKHNAFSWYDVFRIINSIDYPDWRTKPEEFVFFIWCYLAIISANTGNSDIVGELAGAVLFSDPKRELRLQKAGYIIENMSKKWQVFEVLREQSLFKWNEQFKKDLFEMLKLSFDLLKTKGDPMKIIKKILGYLKQ
jgi:hypothetical protein